MAQVGRGQCHFGFENQETLVQKKAVAFDRAFQPGVELILELLAHMVIGGNGQSADRYQGAQEKDEKNFSCEPGGENM